MNNNAASSNLQQQQQLKKEELYGGAMTITVPSSFTNVSDLRQVPDNQEVFMDEASGASLIVELMERVKNTTDDEACAFHFQELARMNKASSFEIMNLSPAPPSSEQKQVAPDRSEKVYERYMIGKQKIAKFNEDGRENDVAIFLGLRRITPPIASDIIVTISYAFNVDDGSSEAQYKFTKKFENPGQLKELGINIFSTLEICHFGLFVPEPEDD